MTARRKNPYERLRDRCREWAWKVKYPKRKSVGLWFPRAQQDEFVRVLHERTVAADALGWDVVLEARDDGLHVLYRKRPPEAPWEIRP